MIMSIAYARTLANLEPKGIGAIIDGDGVPANKSFSEGLVNREVKCVQYNICTGTPVNRTTLAASMIEENVCCLFVQEGRSKNTGILMFEGVIVCRAQSLGGQYGCEV